RRHTRFSRDWSSDVCSSDLLVPGRLRAPWGRDSGELEEHLVLEIASGRGSVQEREEDLLGDRRLEPGREFDREPGAPVAGVEERSEERRVGKEGRTQGARER